MPALVRLVSAENLFHQRQNRFAGFAAAAGKLCYQFTGRLGEFVNRKAHTETEFGIVLKERVGPGRVRGRRHVLPTG